VDRVFLDANILFSASYREDSGLLRLWELAETELITSFYALEEARRIIEGNVQIERFKGLRVTLVSPVWTVDIPPEAISISKKDVPILLDAINARATHLLTGDKQHFGPLFGQKIGGVLILPPAHYLASRYAHDENPPNKLPE
jgi:predicted nucleic acid-binding protein